jgi:anti-sigma factor RsiW
MTDVQTQDQAFTSQGPNQSGVNRTTQTVADPVTGASTSRSTTRAWSGRSPGVELVWLIAGIVIAFLALDFIFHAAGANNVGFAAFVFTLGTALAAPFAGIFKTAYAAQGHLVIWADVLAIVIYALAAAVLAKVVTMAMGRSAATSN